MQFESFAEFIAMDGHGLYVWLCYGVGLIVLAMNLLSAKQARKSLIRELAQKQRREEQVKQQQAGASVSNKVGESE